MKPLNRPQPVNEIEIEILFNKNFRLLSLNFLVDSSNSAYRFKELMWIQGYFKSKCVLLFCDFSHALVGIRSLFLP